MLLDSCRRGKKREKVTMWMNNILQHKDEYYQCPQFGSSCPFVGIEIIVKEKMGQHIDSRQVFISHKS